MNIVRVLVIACFLLGALPAGMALATPSEAHKELEATINSVLMELKKPGLHDSGQRVAILSNVEKIILTLFDFDELSARTVGPNWKSMNEDQKARFTSAFTTLLRETYLEKLNGYNGEVVSFVGESASTTGDKVEIQTSIVIKGKPVAVSYRMLKKQHWVVYDVIIEGISMVQNYRNQFQDLLAKGDTEGLIRQVGVKAVEVREHNKAQQMAK